MLLRRAIESAADAVGLSVEIGPTAATPWASATFAGARHAFDLTVRGRDAADWLAELPEIDLPMRGHLAADVAVIATSEAGGVTLARVEVLTVEER